MQDRAKESGHTQSQHHARPQGDATTRVEQVKRLRAHKGTIPFKYGESELKNAGREPSIASAKEVGSGAWEARLWQSPPTLHCSYLNGIASKGTRLRGLNK